MKKIMKKIIALSISTISLLATSSIGVNAEWRKDEIGWWNTEGKSWSIGWRYIDNKWYYFNKNGYMETGWFQDLDGKYYYLQSDGSMATNTTTPDGYLINAQGVWVQSNISNVGNEVNSKINNNSVTNNTTSTSSQNVSNNVSSSNSSSSNNNSSSKRKSDNSYSGYNSPDNTSIFYFLKDGSIDSVCQGTQSLAFYDQDISVTAKTYGMLVIKNSDYGFVKKDLIKIIPNYKVEDGKLVKKSTITPSYTTPTTTSSAVAMS